MITTIGQLFQIEYGQTEYHNKEWLEGNEGENILISSKGDNNGIYGFFDIEDNYSPSLITVPSTGTVGQAFVQEKSCSVDDNCLVLIPQEKLSKEELFQVAFQIRINKWKYRYGRQITPERLASQKINLIKSKIDYQKLSQEILPKKNKKTSIEENKNIKLMKVSDLCHIFKKTALPQNVVNKNGNIPYISSSSKNNGVVLFVDEEPNFKAGSLTIAKDGNDGTAFYQPFDFITSLHNYILTSKNNLPRIILFYVGAIVKIKCYGYNHYYPLKKKHLKRMQIEVPMKDGEIDLEYIKKIVKNSYGFNELRKYI